MNKYSVLLHNPNENKSVQKIMWATSVYELKDQINKYTKHEANGYVAKYFIRLLSKGKGRGKWGNL